MRSLVVPLAFASACGTTTDDRPVTADYVIDAVLVPYCGRGGCHSSATRARNLAFDTVPDSIAAMQSTQRGQKLVVRGDPTHSRLFTILTDSGRAMPPDVPLPQTDIDLIQRWIADGAEGLP
jgi:hypothetical protein